MTVAPHNLQIYDATSMRTEREMTRVADSKVTMPVWALIREAPMRSRQMDVVIKRQLNRVIRARWEPEL